MILWRIATATRNYGADDLSGAGAAKHPGRWNDFGQPVLYAAPTIALAVLEIAAHLDDSGLPLNRFLVEISVPDDLWTSREILDVGKLNASWAAIPAGRVSVQAGSTWINSGRTALLMAPSVIVPEEAAVVINCSHPHSALLTARIVRQFDYNRLFRST